MRPDGKKKKKKELTGNLDSSVNTFPENMISELFDQTRVAQIFYAPDVHKVKELADNLDSLFNTFLKVCQIFYLTKVVLIGTISLLSHVLVLFFFQNNVC
jgi:hypothetical protein